MSSIGAATYFTIFIVKPNAENSIQNLPLWPVEIASATQCVGCFSDRDVPDPIMCEKVRPASDQVDNKLMCSARKLTISIVLIRHWRKRQKETTFVQIANWKAQEVSNSHSDPVPNGLGLERKDGGQASVLSRQRTRQRRMGLIITRRHHFDAKAVLSAAVGRSAAW